MTTRKSGQFFGRTDLRKQGGGCILSENSYQVGQYTPIHNHEVPLFYFVLEGQCADEAHGIGDSQNGPGTLFFLPAGEYHSTRWSGETHCSCLHLELADPRWEERLRDVQALNERGASRFEHGEVITLVRRLHQEFRRWDNLSPLTVEGIMLELVASAARTASSETSTWQEPRWLNVVEVKLRDCFLESFVLEELAMVAGVHPAHLVRAFRHRFRCTPGDFVRRLRIEEACRRMLATRELSLGQLAADLGFADQSHFHRTFRRLMGVTPGEYRRTFGR